MSAFKMFHNFGLAMAEQAEEFFFSAHISMKPR